MTRGVLDAIKRETGRSVINRIRDWIDAREWHLIATCILLVEAPLLIAIWILAAALSAPWWVMPTAIIGGVIVVGWIILAVSALTRWLL